MTVHLTRADGCYLTDDPTQLDLDRICDWLAGSYWAGGRSRASIEASFRGSLTFGAFTADAMQIGVARAVTDRVTFAWIADVIIDEAYRGQGIGSWLVSSLVADLKSVGVERFVLGTRDAHQVYARIGFEPLAVPEIWMEHDTRANRARRGEPIGRAARMAPGSG